MWLRICSHLRTPIGHSGFLHLASASPAFAVAILKWLKNVFCKILVAYTRYKNSLNASSSSSGAHVSMVMFFVLSLSIKRSVRSCAYEQCRLAIWKGLDVVRSLSAGMPESNQEFLTLKVYSGSGRPAERLLTMSGPFHILDIVCGFPKKYFQDQIKCRKLISVGYQIRQ